MLLNRFSVLRCSGENARKWRDANMAKKTYTAGFPLRKSISLLLAICNLLLLVPGAYAASAGTSPSAVTDSATKVYVKLSKNVDLFTSDAKSSTGKETAESGSVLQLVSDSIRTRSSFPARWCLSLSASATQNSLSRICGAPTPADGNGTAPKA